MEQYYTIILGVLVSILIGLAEDIRSCPVRSSSRVRNPGADVPQPGKRPGASLHGEPHPGPRHPAPRGELMGGMTPAFHAGVPGMGFPARGRRPVCRQACLEGRAPAARSPLLEPAGCGLARPGIRGEAGMINREVM